jgi:hypothetical protein
MADDRAVENLKVGVRTRLLLKPGIARQVVTKADMPRDRIGVVGLLDAPDHIVRRDWESSSLGCIDRSDGFTTATGSLRVTLLEPGDAVVLLIEAVPTREPTCWVMHDGTDLDEFSE